MRSVTSTLLLFPLALGCSAITDYDYRFDGSAMDAGTDSSRDGAADSEVDSSDTDAGVGCPTPCFADLTADAIDAMQPTGAAQWRYLADTRSANGLDYSEMTWTEGWGGAGAFIRRCGSECGDAGAFSLTSTDGDATIEFTVPTRGVYRVGGVYEPLEGASQELLISRDGRNDALARIAGGTVGDQIAFDQTVSLERGDRVRLTLLSAAGLGSVTAGLSAWVSGPLAGQENTCEIAVDFDGDPTLVEGEPTWPAQCGSVTPTGSSQTIAPPTVEASSIGFGNAVFIESALGSYVGIQSSDNVDMSGDFTVQIWGRYDSLAGGAANYRTLFSSVPLDSSGPTGVFVDHEESMTFGVGIEEAEYVETGFDPAEGIWHFFRLVREGTSLQLCIDGTLRGTSLEVGTADLTSTSSLRLGYEPERGPWFDGAVDELRMYGEALPCEVPLP